MPLPKLTWKMLPMYQLTPFSQSLVGYLDGIYDMFNSNVYADGSARITGSGVAWTFFRTSSVDSGSTRGVTAAVYGYPPTMSVVSQTVIFAGSASIPSTTPLVGFNQTYTAGRLYVGIQKYSNPLQYVSWISSSIFNSGSSSRNTVSQSTYQKAVGDFTHGYVQGWESQEAIVLGFFSTSSVSVTVANTSLVFAGAIVDPEISSNVGSVLTEPDGRLYGVIGNGTNTSSDRFAINNVQILFTNLTNDTIHISLPCINNVGFNQSGITKIHARDTSALEYSRPNGEVLVYPIYFTNNYTKLVGRFREIYAYSSKKIHGTVLSDGTRDIGYTIGSTNLCAQDCYFLRA